MRDPIADGDWGSVAAPGAPVRPRRWWSGEAVGPAAAEPSAPLLDRRGAGPGRRSSLWWRIGRRSPAFAGAAVLLILLLLVASLASLLAPYDPVEQGLGPALTPPSPTFPLGLDSLGRDVASRIVHGSRISLLVGAIAVSIALSCGLVLGVLSGYYRGLLETVLMRATDAVFSFPPILLAMAMIAALGANVRNVMIALGIVYTPRFVRLVRVGVLAVRQEEYVASARAVGAGDGRILRWHVLPNMLGPVIVQASFSFGEAIVAEAALSLLGIGTQPPAPSWGLMLSDARDYLTQAPWYPGIVGSALSLVVLSINLVGDGFRDALDPRSVR
jgi:ABC-type dipeptide/oligopeptide/nickel transport system permease subunit